MAMCSMWEWDCDNYSGWPLTLKQAGHSPPTNSCKYPEKRWLVQKYPELPLQKYWPLQKNLSIVSYSFQSIVFKCSDKLFLPQRVLGISSWLPHNYKFTIRLAVLSFTISCYSSPFSGGFIDFKKPMWNDTHLLTGTLKLYFRELPEPLIPFKLFDKFIDAMSKYYHFCLKRFAGSG